MRCYSFIMHVLLNSPVCLLHLLHRRTKGDADIACPVAAEDGTGIMKPVHPVKVHPPMLHYRAPLRELTPDKQAHLTLVVRSMQESIIFSAHTLRS